MKGGLQHGTPISITQSVEALDCDRVAWVRNPMQFKSSSGATLRNESQGFIEHT